MNFKIKYLIIIFLSLFIGRLAAKEILYTPEVEEKIKQVEESLSASLQSSVKWKLSDRMAYYKIHGLSLAVVQNYEIHWAKGYGLADTSENIAVTTETLFQAGSISKSLNAVGVLKLVQDNKLDLYSDINNFLTTWKFPYDDFSNNKKITIANLLSHTAGLSVHGFIGYKLNAVLPTLVQILDGVSPANNAPVRSLFEPGIKYQYSGGGIMISQLIINNATNLDYDVFMKDNILEPMGMENSFYTQPPPKDKLHLLATGYYDNSEVEGKYHIYPEQAAAGLWTTPSDICKYIIETQLSYQGKSSKVLNQELTKLRLMPYIDKSSAFGVFIINNGSENYFYHGGKNEGFISYYIASLNDGNGFAVMYNNSTNSTILTEIFNSIANVYKWEGFYQPTGIESHTISGNIKIFPNPAENYIIIDTQQDDELMGIYSSSGTKILNARSNEMTDIDKLPPGLYFVKSGNKFYKFIKQ